MSYRHLVWALLPFAIVVSNTPAAAQGKGHNKVAVAVSAAPPRIASHAAVMEPAADGKGMKQLRAGTNGWTCIADNPGTPAPDPMCLDASFMNWADAWMNKKAPAVSKVGVGYMLRGDAGASLTDPYATAPTATNQWIKSGAHVMVIVPNASDLEGLPTDPAGGVAYVMWKGTPYVHIMVPVK